MTMRYEILDNNTVEVFYDDSTVPSLRQPNYPGGEEFADKVDAENWANLYIASVEDENAPFAPNARGEAGATKPTAEEIAAMKAEFESRNNPSV
jgi:lipoprotein-anchoring transpeptidase ErfK/SrfK